MTVDDHTTPRRPARDRILDTAFALFYAHGPRGVGVDTIIADAGVAKATFYKHFPRKDDLVLTYLDRVDQVWFGQLRAAARAAGPDPRHPGRALRRPHLGVPPATAITAAPSSTPPLKPPPAPTSTSGPSTTSTLSVSG